MVIFFFRAAVSTMVNMLANDSVQVQPKFRFPIKPLLHNDNFLFLFLGFLFLSKTLEKTQKISVLLQVHVYPLH